MQELVIRQYMGNSPSSHQHCVTVWATLLYAFHCNWMTAMLYNEPKRLYKGFDERFEKNFKYFTQLDSNGRTRMPMQTAMLFIGMSCTKPSCGALCAVNTLFPRAPATSTGRIGRRPVHYVILVIATHSPPRFGGRDEIQIPYSNFHQL